MAVKKSKILIIVLVILVVCAAIPLSLLSALRMDDLPVFQTVPPLEAVEKVRKAEKQGGTVELSEAEVNSILALFTQNQKAIPYIQGVNLKLGDNQVEIYCQGAYAGAQFVLYSQGALACSDGEIVYTPEKFKVGRITVPKKTVLNFLAKKSADKLQVTEGSIKLPKGMLPLALDSIAVAPGVMTIGFSQVLKPQDLPLPSDNPSSSNNPTSSDNPASSNNPVSSDNPASPGDSQKPGGQAPNDNQAEDKDQVSQEEVNSLLAQVSSELSVVHGIVKSEKEKALIATMISTVNNLMTNPDYPYQEKAGWVLSEYKKLTNEEKNDLKTAMLNNMNVSTALEVKKLFGL